MEKLYSVKGSRRTKAFGDSCISVMIYLGDRQIGLVKDSPDTGKPIFDFLLATDRLVFESFVDQWWAQTNPLPLYGNDAIALLAQNPAYAPTLPAKMRFWVESIVQPTSADHRFKEAA